MTYVPSGQAIAATGDHHGQIAKNVARVLHADLAKRAGARLREAEGQPHAVSGFLE